MFTDLNLAQRLEEVEAVSAAAYVGCLAQRHPGVDVAVEQVAGGLAVFAGAGSPLSETKAVGLHGPVTDADLDRLENVFFSRSEPSRVVLCPLGRSVARRGPRPARLPALSFREHPVHASGTKSRRGGRQLHGILVRPVEPDEAELYARVVGPNFVEPGEPVDEIIDMVLTMLGVKGATSFLAWIDGEAVGGGAVILHGGLALLAGAATLPPYRNRGVHAALHHARLAYARANGCDLAVAGCPSRQHIPAQCRAPRPAGRLHAGIAHPRAHLTFTP